MTLGLRRALLFCAQFVPLFLLFLLIYQHALPGYQRVVLGIANVVLARLSPAMEIEAQPDGGWQVYYLLAKGERKRFYPMQDAGRHIVYLNLVLVPAMLLATPVAPKRRLRLLAWGLVLLVLFHVIVALGLVRTKWCLLNAPGDVWCGWVRNHLAFGGQLFAVVEWALLTWSFWLGSDESKPSAEGDPA